MKRRDRVVIDARRSASAAKSPQGLNGTRPTRRAEFGPRGMKDGPAAGRSQGGVPPPKAGPLPTTNRMSEETLLKENVMKKYETPAMKILAPAEKATKGLLLGDKLDTSFSFRLGKPIGFTSEEDGERFPNR